MPPVTIYVMAAVATVAAGVAFKQFVYEPHIAPTVERWTEEFVNEYKARRRQRQRTTSQSSGLEMSVSGVSDYSRPRDMQVERDRRAKAASDWRQLTDSVNELEKSTVATSSAVNEPEASQGLRRRAPGPMDESIESLLFGTLSPSPGPSQTSNVRSPPAPLSPSIMQSNPFVRTSSNQSLSTLFSAPNSPPSHSSPALAPVQDPPVVINPCAHSPSSDSDALSLYASARLTSPRSPFSGLEDGLNPWTVSDDELTLDPPLFAQSHTPTPPDAAQDHTPQVPTLDISRPAHVLSEDDVFSLVGSDTDSDPSEVGSDVGSDGSDDFAELLAASGELSQSSWTRVDVQSRP